MDADEGWPVGREACGVPLVEEGWVEVGLRRGEGTALRVDWMGLEGGTTRGEAAIASVCQRDRKTRDGRDILPN